MVGVRDSPQFAHRGGMGSGCGVLQRGHWAAGMATAESTRGPTHRERNHRALASLALVWRMIALTFAAPLLAATMTASPPPPPAPKRKPTARIERDPA